MDWNEAGEENRKALGRIVAMLLALAGLAERASGRSRPVRYLILWLLRPAEDVALDYVASLTGSAGLPAAMAIVYDGDGPDDAMRLALSFRTLAAALAALTAEAFGSWRVDTHILCIGLAGCMARAFAAFDDPAAIAAIERRDSS